MLIDWEHAICVTIEGSSQIGSCLTDLLLQIHDVFRLDGAGRMVGEVAIEFKVERDEGTGQVLKYSRENHTCHAVASIDDDLERLDLAYVNEGKRVLDIIVGHVTLSGLAFVCWLGEISADG